MRLSILICTLEERQAMFTMLMDVLSKQTTNEVEVLSDSDPTKTIGQKRNDLVDRATGDYIVFIDDDDMVPDYYVSEILKAIETVPDVVGINGVVDFDGKNKRVFKHSLEYHGWYQKDEIYYRSPNHWNPVKREIALSTRFPNVNYGEDWNYSVKIRPKLKTEVCIDKPMYFYHCSSTTSAAVKRHQDDVKAGIAKQSQNGEDKIIMDYFKGRVGTFLDIGAYDGESLSNTFALANNGWNGVLVEPSCVFGKLKELYKDRMDLDLLNVCVGDKNGTVDFWDCDGDMCSSTRPEITAICKKEGLEFRKTTVEMIDFNELLSRSRYSMFDFINIDVENDQLGLEILAQIDMDETMTNVVCIEGNQQTKQRAYEILWQYGFSVIAETPENVILARPL